MDQDVLTKKDLRCILKCIAKETSSGTTTASSALKYLEMLGVCAGYALEEKLTADRSGTFEEEAWLGYQLIKDFLLK